MTSRYALIIVSLFCLVAGGFFYPKWKKSYSEATISWDVSGYYHYLPGIFIYQDLRQQNWIHDINGKYLPSPAYDQSFGHPDSGNKVNKYAIGQAVMFSPFFLLAHAYSKVTNHYPADGYSKPYQAAIWLGGILIAILGMMLLRKILLNYFDDNVTAWTLIAIGLGTHWLEYAAISNGMTHVWLFTLLCVLIQSTIRFYKKPDWISAIGIGVSLGLAALTRPTEIIWAFIPLLWDMQSIKDRVALLWSQSRKVMTAVIICGMIIFIQMAYWKYAANEWFIYSYGGQKIDWLHPRIWRGLMGTNVGWWTYTPLMLIAMFGWYGLFKKQKSIFWPVFVTSALAVYITFSWPYWEQGGGLGQRNLIQIYPLMAFPLSAFITWLIRKEIGRWIGAVLLVLNIYYSFWWIYQAHRGGLFQPGQMTTPYFYSVAGRLYPDKDLMKLMDTDEYYRGDTVNAELIFTEEFENKELACFRVLADSTIAACVNDSVQFAGPVIVPLSDQCNDWLRIEAEFNVQSREWDVWKFVQWNVHFYKGEQIIKSNMIKVNRYLPRDYINYPVHFDVKIPKEEFDSCRIIFWNAESKHTMLIDHLKVYCFGS